ncbi:MAG: hypothetical protein ABI389_13830, partial [Rhodanobacter sp.]
ELQTLLEMAFTGIPFNMHNPVCVRLRRTSVAVNFARRPAAAEGRMVCVTTRTRAADAIGALPPHALAAVEARIG